MTKRKAKNPASTDALTILEALEDAALFAGMGFEAGSWSAWRVFYAALFGLPLTPEQLAIFQKHTGRTQAPTRQCRNATLIIGRRGGKTRSLALIAAFMACVVDHSKYLVAGERAVVACIAKDRAQARVLLNYIAGFIKEKPLLASLIETEQAESIHLHNNVSIEVHTGSIGAPRGRTFAAVLCDEQAFWSVDIDGANPDIEVINATRPGLASIPHSLLLKASSPYAKRGLLYTDFSKYYGKDDAPALVWKASTIEMNSSLIGDPLIAEMYTEDFERADAEFGGNFRSDIVAFITREAIEDVVAHGVRELPPGEGITYFAFTDPSGGSADSMTLAIAHCAASGLAVLDAVREIKPPFSPDDTVAAFSELLKSYGISRVVGDAYAGEWPRERFAAHGITYDLSTRNKSQIYGEFLPALNGQRVRLLDLPRLIGQLVSLERRTARGGRDSIDHAPGSHDDVANAVCGALVNLIADRRPALVRRDALLVRDEAPPLPIKCMWVAAALCTDKAGGYAVVYGGMGIPGKTPGLWLLDFDLGPLHGDIFADILARIQKLICACRAPNGTVFLPEDLRGHAEAAGLPCVSIPADFDVEQRLFSVGAHARAGNVKVCAPALAKAESSPFMGSLDLRAGEDVESPLRAALITIIGLALDDERRMAAE